MPVTGGWCRRTRPRGGTRGLPRIMTGLGSVDVATLRGYFLCSYLVDECAFCHAVCGCCHLNDIPLSRFSLHCHAIVYYIKVYGTLNETADLQPGFSHDTHVLPFFHCYVTQSVAKSGARSAILAVPGELVDAQTIFDLISSTTLPVPDYVDRRGARYASHRWMVPKDENERRNSRAATEYDRRWLR